MEILYRGNKQRKNQFKIEAMCPICGSVVLGCENEFSKFFIGDQFYSFNCPVCHNEPVLLSKDLAFIEVKE